jgi:hypothetical protein
VEQLSAAGFLRFAQVQARQAQQAAEKMTCSVILSEAKNLSLFLLL